MSTAGLYIMNDNDFVQIDSQFKNVCLSRRGNCTVQVVAQSNPCPTTYIVNNFATPITTDMPPLVALKWAVNAFCVASPKVIGSPGNWTGFIVTACRTDGGGDTSFTAQYKAYSYEYPQSSNFGLQVFNEAGTLMYDTNYPPLAVDAYTGQRASWTWGGRDPSGHSIRQSSSITYYAYYFYQTVPIQDAYLIWPVPGTQGRPLDGSFQSVNVALNTTFRRASATRLDRVLYSTSASASQPTSDGEIYSLYWLDGSI